jgi:hypothetical protein
MNRNGMLAAAILTFVVGIAILLAAQNLILPLPVMQQRAGGMPWYITWAMVWITVLCAVALGGFLISAVVRKK